MVDQQPQITLRSVEHRHRQVGLAQRRAGDGQGVDRITLARLTRAAPGTGHQLGWHAHDPLAGEQQVALEPAREVAAVLEGKRPLRPARCPAKELEMARRRRRRRLLGQPATGHVDGHQGVRPLVQIGSDGHHILVSLLIRGWQQGPVGGHA